MGGTGVIDNFLGIFTSYIDGGFGLLGGEVAFIATTLIVIDITMAWRAAPILQKPLRVLSVTQSCALNSNVSGTTITKSTESARRGTR